MRVVTSPARRSTPSCCERCDDLDADERLQLADRLLAVGEDLEHPDAGRVGERLEQVGLDLRQGTALQHDTGHDVPRYCHLTISSDVAYSIQRRACNLHLPGKGSLGAASATPILGRVPPEVGRVHATRPHRRPARARHRRAERRPRPRAGLTPTGSSPPWAASRTPSTSGSSWCPGSTTGPSSSPGGCGASGVHRGAARAAGRGRPGSPALDGGAQRSRQRLGTAAALPAHRRRGVAAYGRLRLHGRPLRARLRSAARRRHRAPGRVRPGPDRRRAVRPRLHEHRCGRSPSGAARMAATRAWSWSTPLATRPTPSGVTWADASRWRSPRARSSRRRPSTPSIACSPRPSTPGRRSRTTAPTPRSPRRSRRRGRSSRRRSSRARSCCSTRS